MIKLMDREGNFNFLIVEFVDSYIEFLKFVVVRMMFELIFRVICFINLNVFFLN